MADLEELSHKIHALIAQVEQVHNENEKFKQENMQLVHENKELTRDLEESRDAIQMLKLELMAVHERLKMNEIHHREVTEPPPLSRVKPYDSDDWDSSPLTDERRKGGKKTSL